MHGDKSQGQRERALASFEAGVVDTLVATDVAARGIDVAGITHVINFDIPGSREDYVHRIGRTARAGASGVGVTLRRPRPGARAGEHGQRPRAAPRARAGRPAQRRHRAARRRRPPAPKARALAQPRPRRRRQKRRARRAPLATRSGPGPRRSAAGRAGPQYLEDRGEARGEAVARGAQVEPPDPARARRPRAARPAARLASRRVDPARSACRRSPGAGPRRASARRRRARARAARARRAAAPRRGTRSARRTAPPRRRRGAGGRCRG